MRFYPMASLAFFPLLFWLCVLRFGMNEVKSSFQMVHTEIGELSVRVMELNVLVGKLEENVITLLKERNR